MTFFFVLLFFLFTNKNENHLFIYLFCWWILGGAAATMLKGRGALQDIDQMSLFQSICKFSITIKYVRDIIPAIKLAIKEAISGTPGNYINYNFY